MSEDTQAPDQTVTPHADEPHQSGVHNRLNWLRAGVLGANDGIVSTAGIVMGVAGATTDRSAILVAGVAGLVAGALSMGTGEYVSVSTQRDSELALLAKERDELRDHPRSELDELASLYVDRGLSEELAAEVAAQLTAHDALAAHAAVELGIDPDDITSPWSAALASTSSFTIGAILPLVMILAFGPSVRIAVTVVAVTLALALTGWASARFGYGPRRPAVLRNVLGGLLAMAITFAIGTLVGTQL